MISGYSSADRVQPFEGETAMMYLCRRRNYLLIFLVFLMADLMAHGARAETMAERGDYFISGDTVLIGCTAGAAAGMLAGSLPVLAALTSGIGLSAGITTLVNLTGLGCGVGAASGGVAILTAWMLDRVRTGPAPAP